MADHLSAAPASPLQTIARQSVQVNLCNNPPLLPPTLAVTPTLPSSSAGSPEADVGWVGSGLYQTCFPLCRTEQSRDLGEDQLGRQLTALCTAFPFRGPPATAAAQPHNTNLTIGEQVRKTNQINR